ncbi:MAG: hypothetical protein GY928_10075 [Colwellia sp.]|nr:hypothetical protein [Colwellia sp.]
MNNRRHIIEYNAPDGTKNNLYSPPGKPKSVYKPRNRKKPTEQEEKKLRSLGKEVDDYLVFLINEKGIQKHRLIRELFGLYKKLALPLFIKTIKRALKYRVKDMNSIKKIALLQIRDGDYEMPSEESANQCQDRESCKEGSLGDDIDLSIYDKLLEE